MDLLEAYARWAANGSGLGAATLSHHGGTLRRFYLSGIRVVAAVDRASVAAFLDARREEVSVASVGHDLAAICSLCDWLERRGLYPLARLHELRRLWRVVRPAPPPSPRFLSREEVAALRAATREDVLLDLGVLLAVGAGLRRTEMLHVFREDLRLDHEQPFLRVTRLRGSIKNRSSERTVPLPRAVADELRGREIPALGRLVPLHRSVLGRRFEPARSRAGLPWVTWHVLRHTFASWHVQAGVSLAKIAGWMGNTPAICWRHYASLAPGGDPDVERGGLGACAPPSRDPS